MQLTHLALTHFRNYRHLELDFPDRYTLLQGQNAQGKTNLLEAIFYLATSKPIHAQTEREVVDWAAQDEPIPYARIAGQVTLPTGATQVEILLTPRGDGVNFTKQVKINGISRRGVDLVGLLRTVLFLPEDIKLVEGAPGERRRYLDIALCQLDRDYFRALAEYQKVLTQRNGLLKQLGEQAAAPFAESTDAQFNFWDEQLIKHGSYVIARRAQFVAEIQGIAQERHSELSAGREQLDIHYLPSFNPGQLSEADFARLTNEHHGAELPSPALRFVDAGAVAGHYRTKLRSRRERELAARTTLYGPHRDELRFVANGRDLRTFGSRGQQRTAALALKLAEVTVSTHTTGVTPLLLLDDVMSELDRQRRHTLLTALQDVEQAIITTTDWEDFSTEFRAQAQLLHVAAGNVMATVAVS